MAVDYSLLAGRQDPYGFGMPYESEEDRRRRLEQEALAQGQTPGGPVAPISQDVYNRNIAQQESGNRPDIGYHDRQKSTAYGPYGMTAGAYQDARRLNPNLPEDITQARPEQLTQAQNAYTQQNASYLRNYGVEPTQNNLAAAHFLGAKGLSDYLKTGYISPQAAQANGGEENVRRIVNARLGGQQAPASGATMPQPAGAGRGTMGMPVVTPEEGVQVATGQGVTTGAPATVSAPNVTKSSIDFINQYQGIQNDPQQLINFGFNENVPEYLRNRAKQRAGEILNGQTKLQQASEILPTMNPKQISDTIQGRSKGDFADYLQYLLFKHVGLNDLANDKAEKLGIGQVEKVIQGEDGKSYMVTYNNKGTPVAGISADGTKLSQEQVINVTGGTLPAGVHISKVTNLIDPDSGVRVTEQTLSDGKTRYRSGGSAYAGSKDNLQDASQWEADQDRKMNAANAVLNRIYPAGATDAQKFSQYKQAGVHPRYIESLMGMPVGSLGKMPSQAQPQPAQAQAPTQAQTQTTQVTQAVPPKESLYERPTQRPGESVADFNVRKEEYEKKRTPLIKNAEAFYNKSGGIVSSLGGLRRAIDALDSGEHNVGPQLGASPLPGVQQAVGGLFGTKASENTKLIESYMTEAGLQGIKETMGPAISNFDVQQKLRQMPVSLRSNPEAVRNYLLKEYKSIYDQAVKSKENAEKLGFVQSGEIDLGLSPKDLEQKKQGTSTGVTWRVVK